LLFRQPLRPPPTKPAAAARTGGVRSERCRRKLWVLRNDLGTDTCALRR
jgi:hypothetical protein